MAWSVSASSAGGPYAATATTTLCSLTSSTGTFVFSIDMSNMVNGDLFRVHVLSSVSSSTTPVQVWVGAWQHVQMNPGKISPPIPSTCPFSVTFESLAGSTTNTYPWQVLSI